MQFILLTIVVAAAGAFVGVRLKLPAGALLGAMIATAIFNIIWNVAYIPQDLRGIVRIVAGTLIGSRITKKDVKELKSVLPAAFILIGTIIVLSPAMGILISKLSHLDITTAVFASAPGGMTDMSLIADELGADTSKVLLLQLTRIITVINLFPIIITFTNKKYTDRSKKAGIGTSEESIKVKTKTNETKTNRFRKLILTILVGVVGGTVGILLNIPAGAMILSMLTVACFNVITEQGYFPPKARVATQTIVGGFLGAGITMQDVIGLKEIIMPVIIMVFGLIIINLFIGFLIHKITKMSLITALLASAPGGMTEMVLISEDLGGDSPKIAILQLVRLVSVISIFPLLLQYLLKAYF